MDYITRKEAEEAVDKRIEELSTDPVFRKKNPGGIVDLFGVKKHLDKIPAADVKQVVRNKWWVYEGLISCMECSAEVEEMTPFCPYCGTDMRKEEKQC